MSEFKDSGNALFKQQKWADAIEEYSKGLMGSDILADARGLLLSNRSQCHLNLKQWNEAFGDADACLKLLPEHAKSLFRRGTAHEQLGRLEEALADYAQVCKAEPNNAAAVQAAARLREQVMKQRQKKNDEILPSNLLDTLRSPAGSPDIVAKQVDACAKLRGLIAHRGLAGAVVSAGAMDVLLERLNDSDTHDEVRESVLAVLVSLASGREAQDEEDDNFRRPPQTDSPLSITPVAEQVRKRLHGLLPVAHLRRASKGQAGNLRQLAVLLGYTHELEDTEALEALHDALCFADGSKVDVPKAGLMGMTSMCDRRRRLGSKGVVVMPQRVLLKCLETALSTSTSMDMLSCLMAAIWTLFADTDRSEAQKIDIADLGHRILEPFLASKDIGLRANGLNGLAALLASSTKAAARMLQLSQVPFLAIMDAIKKPPPGKEGKAAQGYAVDCFFLASGDVSTRQAILGVGGIEILLSALGDGEEGSKGLMQAKLMAVLSILAAHNKDIREEIFDRIDFMVQMRYALDAARESANAARIAEKEGKHALNDAPKIQEVRRLFRALYESCACLTIHGEFKELLLNSKNTLRAIQDLPNSQDLAEDPQLSFFYTSIVFNLCRSKEDKMRPKKDQFPYNELGEDDFNAIEEFYEKMPQEGRPVKNGEVDAGSKDLANKLRTWCVMESSKRAASGAAAGTVGTGSNLVAHLSKCGAHGSVRVKNLVAFIMKFLCEEKGHRAHIVASGGFRTLLGLVDLEEDAARDAARQAMAHICIVTNPAMMQYSEQLDAVRPLLQMCEHRHELMQFEAAMGLTNLLGASDDLRSRCIQGKGWQSCRDLLFSENELVQRAGVEAMCNLCMAPEILERFAEGKCELEIKVFISFAVSEDMKMVLAATGALAMLASCEPVAAEILKNEKLEVLFEATAGCDHPGVQHRLVSILANLAECEDCPAMYKAKIKGVLQAKQRQGVGSTQAAVIMEEFLKGL